jgi:cation transport protein ChaC
MAHSGEARAVGGGAAVWVFGYGSLMWNPGFACAERRPAVLRGYHRAYMMVSTRNRGTPDSPGMVLSLAPGGQCIGMALRIDPRQRAEALAYLDKREGVGRANQRVLMPLHAHGAPPDPLRHGWAYLPVLSYSNYIWGVPLSRQAELVARGCGQTGTSFDYLRLVLEELAKLRVCEPELERLFAEACCCRSGAPPPASASAAD